MVSSLAPKDTITKAIAGLVSRYIARVVANRNKALNMPRRTYRPCQQPAGQSLSQMKQKRVARIGEQARIGRTLERAQRLNRGGEFHAVIRGQRLPAAEFATMLARDHEHAPSAGARVAFACAVGVNDDFGVGHSAISVSSLKGYRCRAWRERPHRRGEGASRRCRQAPR